jgi:hypothetical protein
VRLANFFSQLLPLATCGAAKSQSLVAAVAKKAASKQRGQYQCY